MSTRIEMPELSAEGEGATLANWLVAVGDRVEQGDVIAELETDKSTLELEAPATGTILRFEIEEGTEDIAPGALLGLIEAETAAAVAPSDPAVEDASASKASEQLSENATPAPAAASPEIQPDEGLLRASTPLARRAAQGRDVDLSMLSGTGPGGRVTEEDVLRSAGAGPGGPGDDPAAPAEPGLGVDVGGGADFEAVRLSAMRKTIARRLTESKQQIPHFYLRQRCSMDAILEARADLNRELEQSGADVKVSVNDFVVRAAALALRAVPEANVQFADSHLHVFDRVDVSVAVATDGGLVTPVVRDADRKGLSKLAVEIKQLAGRARAGKLRPEQYQGGTITISNLGMYGIETVYPIVNPPQACILGVGAANEEPVVRDGEVGIGHVAAFTLAADHRVVDGAVGARLLAALRERLEDPLSMLL